MKKMLMGIAIMVLGLSLTSPALAGQNGHSRGQKGHHQYGHRQYYRPAPHHHHRHGGFRAGLYISGGFPVYAPAYGYGPACGYGPSAVVVAPSPYRVWIPGHYAVRSGAPRVYVEGYWAPRGQR